MKVRLMTVPAPKAEIRATSRLRIRNFLAEDADDLQEILGDDETMRYAEPPYDEKKTKAFLDDFCIARGRAVAAVHRKSGKLIGYILFSEIEWGVYELGWFFNRDYWGMGYAYEACRAMIEEAFVQRQAKKVFAETIDPGKSLALMKRLGMLPDADAQYLDGKPSIYTYAITRRMWMDKRRLEGDLG